MKAKKYWIFQTETPDGDFIVSGKFVVNEETQEIYYEKPLNIFVLVDSYSTIEEVKETFGKYYFVEPDNIKKLIKEVRV